MKAERIPRTFHLYKSVSKAIKRAAAFSEDIYGEELSQAELVNRILAKALKVDLTSGDNGEGSELLTAEEIYRGEKDEEEETYVLCK